MRMQKESSKLRFDAQSVFVRLLLVVVLLANYHCVNCYF